MRLKFWPFLAAVALAGAPAFAQTASQGIQPLRYNDDFRYLTDPAKRDDFWDPIKFIPLSWLPGAYLTLGGELREKYEYYSPRSFGLSGNHADGYLLHRLMLNADLHVSDALRVFVQFSNEEVEGKYPPVGGADRDRFDVQQAFVDVKPFADGPLVRLGRQEISLGSQRLVSVRESPNIRRSFDGVRVSQTIAGVKLDAFFTRPTEVKPDAFDDRANPKQMFWGLYATTPLPILPGGGLDLYYLGLDNHTAKFGTVTAPEHRHSVGSRLFGAHEGWDWDFEGVWQFGSFGTKDIEAWTIASSTGYTFALPWSPRIGAKADIASGTRNLSGHTLGTFDPLFPKLAYFSEASLIAPGNIANFYPTLTLKPLNGLTVTIGYDFLRKAQRQDAIYGNPFTPLAGTTKTTSRNIGNETTIDVGYQFDRHVTVSASYDHFEAGRAIKQAGGRSVDYYSAQVSYRF